MLTFNNILYVYSDAVNNATAIKKAVTIAKKYNAQLTVLFTITEQSFPEDLGLSQADINHYFDQLDEDRAKILSELSCEITIQHKSIHNDSHIEVIKKVKQYQYDLVIKPSKNDGLVGRLLGSNDMGYLRQCPCPVMLIDIESTTNESSDIVIAAIDVNDKYPEKELSVRAQLNSDVLKAAALIAVANSYRLKVISSWSAPFESALKHAAFTKQNKQVINTYIDDIEQSHQENLQVFMSNLKETLGEEAYTLINPELVAVKGKPEKVIAEYSKKVNANLVVMGTVARVGIPGLIIGNTAENILYRLNQSLLAIKPKGFKTLIE